MSEIKIDFFIAGGPKCGTTALWDYLRGHPDIYFPDIKEPHYYAEDLGDFRTVKDRQMYQDLFEKAKSGHVKGEASVFYAYSDVALERVHLEHPDAGIIFMIRNPIEVVHSLHAQLLYTLNETEESFWKAWKLQEIRASGEQIPETCSHPDILQYKEIARFGQQLLKLQDIFGEEKVHVILFDDFTSETREVYKEVLSFLDVRDDGREQFDVVNRHKTARSKFLSRFIKHPPDLLKRLMFSLKDAFNIERLALMDKLEMLNRKPSPRKDLPLADKKKLFNEFREDIILLQNTLKRDLSHWKPE